MHFVTRLDMKKYSCVTKDIATDEVIITDRQIAHIEERHPGDWEKIRQFLSAAVDDPDFILDEGSPSTGLLLKNIKTEDRRIQIILRLHTAADEPHYKNSIISAWTLSESRWRNYIKNKKVLYRKE